MGHALGNDLRVLQLEDHPRGLLRDTSKYPSLMKELTGGRKASASLKVRVRQTTNTRGDKKRGDGGAVMYVME